MNVYLVGYRCCGKSSLGRLLAGQLGWSFVDTDALVAAQTGQAIAAIVETRGWAYFRQREQDCVAAVAAQAHRVVATGGGVVLAPQNIAAMKGSGVIVWLTATTDVIRERMRRDRQTAQQRPALTRGDAQDEIESVLAARIPLYRAASDIELNTDRESIPLLVQDLIVRLKPFMRVAQGAPGTGPVA